MRSRPTFRLAATVSLMMIALGCGVGSGSAHASCNSQGHSGCTGGATGPVAQTYGFNDNALFNPQIPREYFLDKLKSEGASYLRSDINWQFYEPKYKQYDNGYWAQFDRNYQDLLAKGVHEVIILIGTPYWALTPSGRGATSPDGQFRCDGSDHACVAPPDIYQPQIRAEWKAFVRKVVTRYPKAAAIEVWNEPNIQYFWLQKQDPTLYAHLLAATTRAAHHVDPSMPVLAGSTADYVGQSDATNTSADVFLRDIYKAVGSNAFSAISWHFYPCNDGQSVASQGDQLLGALRKVRDSFGDLGKPLWLTEVGASSGNSSCGGPGYGATGQANALVQALDWARSQQKAHDDLPVVLVNELMDEASRPALDVQNASSDNEYGLVAYHYDANTGQTTFVDKPAFAAVHSIIDR